MAKWVDTTFNSFAEFAAHVTRYKYRPTFPYAACRGQSRRWELRPSLARILPFSNNCVKGSASAVAEMAFDEDNAREIEKQLLDEFKAYAHRFIPRHLLPEREGAQLRWLSLMQHYGAPTRLLDWTISPYIALYHAVKDDWGNGVDGCVWVFPGNLLMLDTPPDTATERADEWLVGADRHPSEICLILDLPATERVAIQQGCFTVAKSIGADHESLVLESVWDQMERPPVRIRIPNEKKPEILLQLKQADLTPASLSPSPDTFGEVIKQSCKLKVAFDVLQRNNVSPITMEWPWKESGDHGAGP